MVANAPATAIMGRPASQTTMNQISLMVLGFDWGLSPGISPGGAVFTATLDSGSWGVIPITFLVGKGPGKPIPRYYPTSNDAS
jgi:hypothetical protein